MSTLRWRCLTTGSSYDKALRCCRWSRVRNSERSLHYECLQPKPAWCLKQLRADVEPMIIFWVGLGSSTLGRRSVRWESLPDSASRCSSRSHHMSSDEETSTFLLTYQLLGQSKLFPAFFQTWIHFTLRRVCVHWDHMDEY